MLDSVQMGPRDVMDYSSPEQGVFYPRKLSINCLRWNGGFLERHCPATSKGTTQQHINPFRKHRVLGPGASQSFTEPGEYMRFMHLPACGPSQLGAARPKLEDCATQQELVRGNVPLAELNSKPQDDVMSPVQWCAFTGLRGHPCSQMRNLCVALQEGTLALERPEVLLLLFSCLYGVLLARAYMHG